LKVAVYTIALNEEKHVERWYESAKDADYLLIADTGSTDRTVEIAKSLGINVINIRIDPWRFDDARNAALASLPADIDYCVILDMDEILQPGWKDELPEALDLGITRPVHRIITDWEEDGSPKVEFDGNRIHARRGYRWKNPIHEVIVAYNIPETRARIKAEIHHRPDNSKSRGQYLPMLEMAVQEDPHDARSYYYLGREYFYKERFTDATKTLKKYLELSNFPAEKSYALRILAKTDPENAESYLQQAIDQCPSREAVLGLANYYYHKQEWRNCFRTATRAVGITEKRTDFLSEGWAWTHMADDLCAISAWQLGEWKLALDHGTKAVEITPTDERLVNNLKFYREKVNEYAK